MPDPFAGTRMLWDLLQQEGPAIGRRQVASLMRAPDGHHGDLSEAEDQPVASCHQNYPSLLRQLMISRSKHVEAADTTDIPMRHGFVYLCPILDWASRRVVPGGSPRP